jgi:hypothetical protein
MLTIMRALTWPKLIGTTVGLIGFGSMMSAVGAYLPVSLFTDPFPLRGPESWVAVGASVLGLALAYPLYRACDWARRVLFVISLLFCVGFTIIFLASVFRRPNIAYDGDASRITAEQIADFRRQEHFVRLNRAGDSLWPLTLAGFLTIALLHPDVVQAFRRRATPDDHQNT